MARRMRLYPWMAMLLILAMGALAWGGSRFYLTHEYRQQLARHTLGKQRSAHVQFANACRYRALGQDDKALAAYAEVAAMEDTTLRRYAYFNSGNLYLMRAMRLLEMQGLPAWDEAGPLIALAKESFQNALRLQPWWPEAKYNYQLALRLAPSSHGMQGPQRYEDDAIGQAEDPIGWPAMPGNPRGMP